MIDFTGAKRLRSDQLVPFIGFDIRRLSALKLDSEWHKMKRGNLSKLRKCY